MKINWGTGIVLGMIAFIGFIMFMVITMMTDKNYDHDLVTEAYYERDLAYQTEIDAEKKANGLSAQIQYEKTSEGIWFTFPQELGENTYEGTVEMYRPSNEKLDYKLPLKLTDLKMLVPDDQLVDGFWKVSIHWKMNGEDYLYKKEIRY